jgi:small subunit ribosomal protein S19
MVKKVFKYQGKTLEELQALSLKELSQILPSNARRKINRLTDDEKILLEKIKTSKKTIKTHTREMIILPFMVGKTIKVHNGKEFVDMIVQPEMIGHRFGEYSFTRKRLAHSSPGVGATKSSGNVSVK